MRIILASVGSENKTKYALERISEHLISQGVETSKFDIVVEDLYTVSEDKLLEADLVVYIGKEPQGLSIPTVDGMSFIARVPFMEADTCNKIYSIVKEKIN